MPSPKWYRVKRRDGTWSKWYRSAALATRSEDGQVFQWNSKKGDPVSYGDKPRGRRSAFPVATRGRRGRVNRSWEERERLHQSIYSDPEGSRNLLSRRGVRSIDPVSPKVHSLAGAAEKAIDSRGTNVVIHQEGTFPGTRIFVTDAVQVTHQKTLDEVKDAKVSLLIRVNPRTGKVRGYKIVPMKYGRAVKDDIISLRPDASRSEVIEEMAKAYKRL